MVYELKDFTWTKISVLLASCYNGSLYINEAKKYKELYEFFDTVLEANTQARRKAVRWFVGTSIQSLKHRGGGFLYSLDKDIYTGNEAGLGYRGVRWVTEGLEKLGYIDLYKGFVIKWNFDGTPRETVSSFLKFTERTYQKLSKVDLGKVKRVALSDCVEVRNRETKQPKSLKGFRDLKKIRDNVMHLNDILADTKVELNGEVMSSVQMKRVFTENLELGGRFYVVGGGVQLAPKMARYTTLFINDSKVVELDYKSMHPNLLFEKLNIHDYNGKLKEFLGANFDPYGADISDLLEVNQAQVNVQRKRLGDPKYDPERTFKKIALLVMLNARSIESAVGAMCRELMDDADKHDIDKDFFGLPKGIKVKKILERIAEHNRVISDFFFCDVALTLMNTDSKIADRVAEILMQEGQPVLIYHDSFIVKQEAEKLLYDAMKLAWKEEVGDNQFCYIEKK